MKKEHYLIGRQVEDLLKESVIYANGEKKYKYECIKKINELGVRLKFTQQGVFWEVV